MENKRCCTCRHFSPARNPDTGRARTSEPGTCTWQPPAFPVMAASYAVPQWGTAVRMPNWPTKHGMYRYNGENCEVWEAKKPAKPQDRQVPLIAPSGA